MKAAFIAAIAAFSLASCSNQPMTPEQSAQVMQIIQMNQHNTDEMNRNAAIIAAGAARHAPTNCITSYVGDSAYTTCQ